VRTFDVIDDQWLPARGTFLVADSLDPALNHELQAPIVAWTGQPGDVLRNKGATISLFFQGVLVDAVTYPALTVPVGTSVEFPSDCPPERRADWTAWLPGAASWFPGFHGTPNAPNDDVHCP
jgi:hypothetical protein